MTDLMTLSQLAEAAARLVSGVDQASGRVREVPDVRTIRYYTTLGLIDRAAQMRGRTAYYGERHLQQLCAIKRLQAEGLTLEAIQARLLGATAKDLAEIAPVPAGLVAEAKATPARSNFWKERPVPAPALTTMQTVQLAPGALLTIDVKAPLSAQDQQALLESAQALLRWIEQYKEQESK